MLSVYHIQQYMPEVINGILNSFCLKYFRILELKVTVLWDQYFYVIASPYNFLWKYLNSVYEYYILLISTKYVIFFPTDMPGKWVENL